VAQALAAGYRTPNLAGVAGPDDRVEVVGTQAMGAVVRQFLAA
jgi:hypothetical protein